MLLSKSPSPLFQLFRATSPAGWAAIVFWASLSNIQPALAQPAQPSQPDIVLIVADDLGWGDLGCYGAADMRTPALDQLASEGLRWENFYANCCVCSPTRAAILSGCYPDRVGVPGVIRTHADNNWGKLSPDAVLLPQLLRGAGYQTTAIGKWHLGLGKGDHPLDRGFDNFHGFLGDMMDDYYLHRRHENNYMQRNRTPINPAGHATSLFATWASSAINRMSQEESPYFLYLAFNAPHTPIQPPASALQRVHAREPNIDGTRAKLVALIEDMDAAIGRVLEQVRRTGRDTLVVFVSDNGGQVGVGANNGPWRDGKGSKYEGGLRIPAIFHWPGKIAEGGETAAIGVTMDLMPTLCRIGGADVPSDIDGQDLERWMSEPAADQNPREIYYVRREGGPKYCGLTIEALRLGDWKLVHNFPSTGFELFNLTEDPREANDLADSQPRQLRKLQSALMRHIQRGGQTPWQSNLGSP